MLVGHDDDEVNLFIILRLCGKHDKILCATHTVATIVEAFFTSDTQSIVDALN